MNKWLRWFTLLLLALGACAVPAPADPSSTVPMDTPPPLATRTPMPTATATPERAPWSSADRPLLSPTPSVEQLRYRLVGYFPAWSNPARDEAASDLPGTLLTHVIYAFGNIDPKTHTCVYGDANVDDYHLRSLGKLKQKYPHVKVLIAIGGATVSKEFSDMAVADESRQKFVKSCLDLYVGTYPDVIDGVDMDWEYPGVGDGSRPEDKQNFTALMKEFRRQLDGLGKRTDHTYLLTAAVPAGPGLYQNLELQELTGVLDWFNLMTYDFNGVWNTTTNFTAPLYRADGDPFPANNVDAAVLAYLKAGVPPRQITLGMPFYGRGWANVGPGNNGLYQRTTRLARGSFSGSAYTYKDLVENYINQNGYTRYWNDEAKVPWLYSPADRVFITYEDPESIGYKADYIADHLLGGAMIWHLSSDDGSLLRALYERLSAARP